MSHAKLRAEAQSMAAQALRLADVASLELAASKERSLTMSPRSAAPELSASLDRSTAHWPR